MNQDEIIEMARQAGINNSTNGLFFECDKHDLSRFAKLVEAHIRGQIFKPDWDNYRQGLIDGAVSEREAVLDLVDGYAKNNIDLRDAIQARGEA